MFNEKCFFATSLEEICPNLHLIQQKVVYLPKGSLIFNEKYQVLWLNETVISRVSVQVMNQSLLWLHPPSIRMPLPIEKEGACCITHLRIGSSLIRACGLWSVFWEPIIYRNLLNNVKLWNPLRSWWPSLIWESKVKG